MKPPIYTAASKVSWNPSSHRLCFYPLFSRFAKKKRNCGGTYEEIKKTMFLQHHDFHEKKEKKNIVLLKKIGSSTTTSRKDFKYTYQLPTQPWP